MKGPGLEPGAPILVYLHSPREKVFGVLLSLGPAGIEVRGLDVVSLEDWMREQLGGEPSGLGLASAFYPMWRIERIERDESTDALEGLADRFRRLTGRLFSEAAGLPHRARKKR